MLKKISLLPVISLILSGCAATTEPPVRAWLSEQRAYTEIKQGHLAQAEFDLKRALRDNPTDPTILNNLAFIQFKNGNFNNAIGYLEQARALKSNDNDEPFILNEARILISAHHYRKALTLLSLIEPRTKWPHGYRKMLARALIHNGKNAKALAILLEKHDETGMLTQTTSH